MDNQIDVSELLAAGISEPPTTAGRLTDAIDAASDQDHTTYLTADGRRIAAIVPADVAEEDDLATATVVKAFGTGVQVFRSTARGNPRIR